MRSATVCGGVLEVRRHLHRELPLRRQLVAQPLDQRRMIRRPLQARIGEHHVDRFGRRPRRQVTLLEPHAVAGVGRGLLEHVGRAVDADGLDGVHMTMQLGGELTGTAAEVDDPAARHGLHHGEEVVERLAALGLEAVVGRGIPCVCRSHAYKSNTS